MVQSREALVSFLNTGKTGKLPLLKLAFDPQRGRVEAVSPLDQPEDCGIARTWRLKSNRLLDWCDNAALEESLNAPVSLPLAQWGLLICRGF
jgi:hypothetical protein